MYVKATKVGPSIQYAAHIQSSRSLLYAHGNGGEADRAYRDRFGECWKQNLSLVSFAFLQDCLKHFHSYRKHVENVHVYL